MNADYEVFGGYFWFSFMSQVVTCLKRLYVFIQGKLFMIKILKTVKTKMFKSLKLPTIVNLR